MNLQRSVDAGHRATRRTAIGATGSKAAQVRDGLPHTLAVMDLVAGPLQVPCRVWLPVNARSTSGIGAETGSDCRHGDVGGTQRLIDVLGRVGQRQEHVVTRVQIDPVIKRHLGKQHAALE